MSWSIYKSHWNILSKEGIPWKSRKPVKQYQQVLSRIEFEPGVLRVETVGTLRLFQRGRIQANNVYDVKITLEKRISVGDSDEGSSA